VGVNVNETRCYHQTLSINHLLGAATDISDCYNAIPLDAHIAVEPGIPGAIHDLPTADENVVLKFLSPKETYRGRHPHTGHHKDGQDYSVSKAFHKSSRIFQWEIVLPITSVCWHQTFEFFRPTEDEV
jgi:hypothetical protein